MVDYTYSDFEIIDAHTHIYPAKIAAKAADSIGVFYDLPAGHIGSSEELRKNGARFGVSRYLVCSVATSPAQVHGINDFIARECGEHPEFFGFGTLNPDMDDPQAEVDRIISLGLHGVKLHPDFQHFYLDEERAFHIYEAIAGRLPLLLHMGDDRYTYSRPQRLVTAMEAFPRQRFMAAHFGGYHAWDEAKALLRRPGLVFDTSSSLPSLDRETARGLIDWFGAENCFFGTDFPLWRYDSEVKNFFDLELPYETARKILGENFKRYFGLDTKSGIICPDSI